MKRLWTHFSISAAFVMVIFALFACGEQEKPTIFYSGSAMAATELAAKEINKYIYQRTGRNSDIRQYSSLSDISGRAIVLMNTNSPDFEQLPSAVKDKVAQTTEEGYSLIHHRGRLYIVGGSEIAVLYGAYRYAERIGVRFYLHGDVIPDEPYAGSLIKLTDEVDDPLFSIRGILPFHDFPEGPDWWNEDNYKAYFAQLTKMRMNFFGLHTYPEDGPHAEPTIWIGCKEDIGSEGVVKYSYPSTFANTMRDNYWSYAPMKTGEFCMGADQLFDRDAYGADVLRGIEEMPSDMSSMNTLFERTGMMLASSFEFGRRLGIKFSMGTETPLTIPLKVREHLQRKGIDPDSEAAARELYEGIFTRIEQTYPIDYYWLWTPESWTWGNPTNRIVEQTENDIRIAGEVLSRMNYPFELALSGWVLGPPQDRSGFDKILPKRGPISCISRMWGQDRIERGFNKIEGRQKWAIPWIEEDPRMTIPQFWVGRMRADAADALKYNCTGLIGIHWRTRSVAPNFNALAEAAWDQQAWNPDFGKPYIEDAYLTEDVRIEGKAVSFDDHTIKGAQNSAVFNTLTYGMKSYLIKVPKGTYKVKLQFCEPVYDKPGMRIFGVNVEGEEMAAGLDVFAKVGKDAAYEIWSKPVRVDDGVLNIDFNIQTEHPIISGIVVEGVTDDVNQIKGQPYRRAINAGGPAYAHYEADLPEGTGMDRDTPRDMEALSFYKDYAAHEFGRNVADRAAEIFLSVDGFYGNGGNDNVKIPRPANWISMSGPGAVMPNKTSWAEERDKYEFVDKFVELAPEVTGKGNLDRYNYWANTFLYTRAMAKLGCTRGELDLLMEKIETIEDKNAQKSEVLAKAFPLRIRLAREWEAMMGYLIQTVYTPGELGTVANIEQLSRRFNNFLNKHDQALEKIGEVKLPEQAQLSSKYNGPTRIVMLSERSVVAKGEKTEIRAIVLSASPTAAPILKYRPLGVGDFRSLEMNLLSGSTYSVTLPAVPNKGMEYYISVGDDTRYPATAPSINNTVVEM